MDLLPGGSVWYKERLTVQDYTKKESKSLNSSILNEHLPTAKYKLDTKTYIYINLKYSINKYMYIINIPII